MKKIFVIIAAFTLASVNAGAQFFAGVAFDVKWSGNGEQSATTTGLKATNTYSGTISPQFGYKFSPKLMAGSRFNINFEKKYYTVKDDPTEYLTASVGWDVAPFVRYRVLELGKNGWFSVWADVHAYYGTMYPSGLQEPGFVTMDFNRKHNYGIQAMPALGFKINEKTSIFMNLALISFAYTGSTTLYNDKTTYENNVVLFTMKLSGLFTALTSDSLYGVKLGLVRTF